jgi:pimeloyl-ACP methyl ester carboxylesterase
MPLTAASSTMRPVSIESPEGLTLRGMLHLPDEERQGRQREAAILLPGLVGTRCGPHRILYDLACALAQLGTPVLRCDPAGTGYSDAPAEPASLASMVRDARRMMDFLTRELGAERFLLGGICRGAKTSLAVSLGDPRVDALMLLGCGRLREDALKSKIRRRRGHHLKQYFKKFLTMRWLPRLLKGDLNWPMIGKALLQPVSANAVQFLYSTDVPMDFSHFSARAIFVYGENDPDRKDSMPYYQNRLSHDAERLEFHIIDEADLAFYNRHWHEAALSKLRQWQERRIQ